MPDKDNDSRNEYLRRLSNMDEWEAVQNVFWEHMNDMQSIMNLNPEGDIEQELKARRMAIEYMKDLWKELNGSVEQKKMNSFNKQRDVDDYSNKDDYINRNEST